MSRTRIKICGFTREADIDAAVAAGVDAVGLNLWSGSPRGISVERAAALAARLPPFVTPVCLFVNADPALVRDAVAAIPNALLQFHGDETPAQCDAARRPYLRALRMAAGVDLLDWARRYPNARALLVDADAGAAYGGSGKVFDWSLIPKDVPVPVVLSGGLNPANVTDGVLALRPWAVDASSGVESAKGVKDAQLMRRFCDAVVEADARIADAGV